ncbi:lipid II flippase MurJ, partial [Streptomyces sp. SR27]|uniref:lipid II flippase MurJ n=1 Tax=Streptomyces sp. SR27 TaxID=3076630 RepID=UPI003FA36979
MSVEQHVTAHSGYAYGVIGADIHVYGDGSPIYLLQNWRRAPATDPEWLRELPSRMLNSRFEVVPFTGRDAELAGLRAWRDEGPRLAVRWMHAPGGQGKTRLAARFADSTQDEGWRVVAATNGPGSVQPPPGSHDLSVEGRDGVLLVVDYADRWPLTHLTWLFSNALLHRAGVRARVLLLARTADAWPAVRASVSNLQAGTSSMVLEDLPDGNEMYEAARDAFAVRYGVPAAPGPPPPYGLTLALHMAALVSVDAQAHGRRPPADLAGLTVYLLDREHLHWGTLFARGDGRYATPPQAMNRAVFAAALGAGYVADGYAVGNSVPTIVYMLLLGGALNAVFVPELVKAAKEHADGGVAYTDRLLTLCALALTALTAAAVLAAPQIVDLYTDYAGPQREMTVAFARACLPQILFLGLFTLLGQVLNARGRFGAMMWTPVLNNVVVVAVFGLFLVVSDGGELTPGETALLGWGTTAGIALQALALVPSLRAAGFRWRPRFDWRGSGLAAPDRKS